MVSKRKLLYNTWASLVLQIVTILCGFILPRLILGYYGSDINGLINSITQFLGIISLLDMGVGTVIQSALYKPLAQNDCKKISEIYNAANNFFRKIAIAFLAYIILLLFFFPLMVKKTFDFVFVDTLMLAMGISTFAQYFFGIVNTLFLEADQRGYIQYTIQTISLMLNTALCAILILLGASIQVVKLTTSMVFILRPVVMEYYVRRHYVLNRKISFTEDSIPQKWNGIAQHIASFVLSGTDNIVLTALSTLANVSIYSVYNLVINGVFTLVNSLTKGFCPYLGNLIANKDDRLKEEFSFFEWIVHALSTVFFGCTSILIIDFIKIYTNGVYDANYIQPLFSIIMIFAYFARTLRIPYNYMILAAGHYKQTQSNYIIATLLNIIISIATVSLFGLIGVALGTLIALLYQTLWMAKYCYNRFIFIEYRKFLYLLISDCFTFATGYFATNWIPILEYTFISWIFKGILVTIIWALISISMNYMFNKKYILAVLGKIKGRKE